MHGHGSQVGDLAEIRLSGFGGVTGLFGSPDDLGWVTEFFSPALRSMPQAATTETVHTDVDSRRYLELHRRMHRGQTRRYECFTLDGHFESFSGCASPDGGLVVWLDTLSLMLCVNEARDVFHVIAESPEAKLRVGVMRVLREIATVRALRSGALPLHGAACVVSGMAVGFLGPKRAGKTTALIHWLQTPRARFLANDRFFVFHRDATWFAQGMPTIVSVRTDTLRHFEALRRRLGELPYRPSRTLAEVQAARVQPPEPGASVYLSQAQFLEITERSAEIEAPVGMLLFPERDDRLGTAECESLPTPDGMNLLRSSLLSPGPRLATSEVFDREPRFEVPEEAVRETCHRLSAAGFCHRYRQGFRTLASPATMPWGGSVSH